MNKFYCSSKIFRDGSKNKAPSAHLAVFLRVPIKEKSRVMQMLNQKAFFKSAIW